MVLHTFFRTRKNVNPHPTPQKFGYATTITCMRGVGGG